MELYKKVMGFKIEIKYETQEKSLNKAATKRDWRTKQACKVQENMSTFAKSTITLLSDILVLLGLLPPVPGTYKNLAQWEARYVEGGYGNHDA